MTAMENRIVEAIKSDPYISQEELASRLGITRSSVSIHIMNLIKRQIIKGRGYILRENIHVAVIGSANVDIDAVSFRNNLRQETSPGKAKFSLGGVGRNVAENLSILKDEVEFMTIFSNDFYGKAIKSRCHDLSIGISHALTLPNISTSIYVSISAADGSTKYSVSDTEIHKNITKEYICERENIINSSKICFVDPGIADETLEYIFENIKVPIVSEAVTLRLLMKLERYLGKVDTLILHKSDAEKLYDDVDMSVERIGTFILNKGVKNLFLFDGINKVHVFDQGGYSDCLYSEYNITPEKGISNAFTAGIIHETINGRNVSECCSFAMKNMQSYKNSYNF